jgi:hypothetical protein
MTFPRSILAIDPGPYTCGAVLYDWHTERRVLWSDAAAEVGYLCSHLWLPSHETPWRRMDPVVLIERVRSYGKSGNSLFETSESVGRLYQSAWASGLDVHLVPRKWVVQALGADRKDAPGGKTTDSKVIAAMLDRVGPQGTKAAPGPTYGVKSHAWQALGLAVAWDESEALQRRVRGEG